MTLFFLSSSSFGVSFYKLLDFETTVVNPCFGTRVLPKGPCIRTSRDMKTCTNYLVSKLGVVNFFFTRDPPKKNSVFARVRADPRKGVFFAPRRRPLQQVNCTHSTLLVEPLLVTLERLRLNPLQGRSFLLRLIFFHELKSILTFCPQAVSTICLHEVSCSSKTKAT